MKQYIFNSSLFDSSFEGCPAILCFPTFLSLSLITIINNKTSKMQSQRRKDAKDVIYRGFFHIIPTLVKCLYREVDPTEPLPRLKKNINHLVFSSIENVKLEYLMEEEEDRLKYRQLLDRVNLKWNGVGNRRDLLSHLVSTNVCPLIDDDDDEDDDSLQYTPLNTKRYPEKKQGPALWGPYFWKIFHFIGNLKNEDDDPDIYYMQDAFIGIINSLVPCPLCEINYNDHIKPSQFSNAIHDHATTYIKIHERVNNHVGGG